MLEIELPAEIDKVERPIIWKLKVRHLAVFAINVLVGSMLYAFLYGVKYGTWGILLVIIFITFIGMIRVNEMYFEEYSIKILQFKKNVRVLSIEELWENKKVKKQKVRKEKIVKVKKKEKINKA